MHSRSEWTSFKPAFGIPWKNVRDIFIHNEGGGIRGVPADKPLVLRQIEAYVRTKGYIAIDYNVMVFNDGDVWAGREIWNEDAATWHNNETSLSICAVGNYDRELVSDLLVQGIHSAIREIVASGYSVKEPSIRMHREVYPTSCPGANLVARFDEIKNWQSVLTPPPPPPPPSLQSEDDMSGSFFYPANGDWHRIWIATKPLNTTKIGDVLHLYGPATPEFPQGRIENMTQKYAKDLGPQDSTKPVEFGVAENKVAIVGTTMDMTGAISVWRFDGNPITWRCIPYFPQ